MWSCVKAAWWRNWSFLLTSDAPGQFFNTWRHMHLSWDGAASQALWCDSVLPWDCSADDTMKTLVGCFCLLLNNCMLTDLKRPTSKLCCTAGSCKRNSIEILFLSSSLRAFTYFVWSALCSWLWTLLEQNLLNWRVCGTFKGCTPGFK